MNATERRRYAGLLSKIVTFFKVFLILLTVLFLGTAIYYYTFGFAKGFDQLWMVAFGNVEIQVDASGLKAAAMAPALGREVFGMMMIPLKTTSPFLLNTHFFYMCIWLFLSFYLLGNIRSILSSIRDDMPFTEINVKRIRTIGVLLILIHIADTIHISLNDWWIGHQELYQGMGTFSTLYIDWSGLFSGLILLLLAEVFRHGLRLQEEQDLTV